MLIRLGAGVLAFLPGLAWAGADIREAEKPSAPTPPPRMVAYCGVQSLYRALRGLGKEIDYADLVKPEYISSRKGSSNADLKKAAEDFGATAEPMNRMTCAMLRQVDCPVILHVRFDLESNEYNHWVLFMGTEGGKAKIYDRYLPAAEIGFDELAARWDGSGLLISDSPIKKTGIWLAGVCPFLLYAGLAAFAVGVLVRIERRWRQTEAKASWTGAALSLGQAAGLVVIALGAAIAYRATSAEGYLSSRDAITAIQDSNFGSFLPKVKTEEMARLVDTPGIAVVDARFPLDFSAGHLPGAISIPVSSSTKRCEDAMSAVPKDHRIVVYSHSNGCPYGEKIAKKLISLGYHDIVLFRGGWVEWEKRHPLPAKSGELAQGN